MDETVRILHLEDDSSDIKLVRATIETGGIRCHIVSVNSREGFENALTTMDFSLILADYILPGYDGITALRYALNTRPEIPFLFVSGTMGEDAAIEGLTSGALDYVPKPKMYRLLPAIKRALQDAQIRRERSRAEKEVEQQRIELKAIYDNTPLLMTVLDNQQTVLFANRAFIEFCGRPETELKGVRIGQCLGCRVALESRSLCGDAPKCELCPLGLALQSTFKAGVNHRSIEHRTTLIQKGDQREVVLSCSIALLPTGDRNRLLLSMDDISRKVSAEEERDTLRQEYLQAQKMEGYGRLAGGVAHDFNNLLTVIINSCELGRDSVPDDSPAVPLLTMALKTSLRAAELTRQLLAFSRKQVMELKILDLNGVVIDVAKMLRRIIGDQIELQTALSPDACRVFADSGQIGQVLLNLVINAKDAMPEGGRLVISTSREEIRDSASRFGEVLGGSYRDIAPGDYACLKVIDTGTGIPERIIQNLIEPFFTTKEPGKGTGLGLPTVFGIVKQCKGHLLVQSSLGSGTTFSLLFPLSTGSVQEEPCLAPQETLAGGAETILIVDDSEDLRTLTCKILSAAGYTVLAASNGQEASLVSRGFSKPIHLLLADVVMPGISGPKLWKDLLDSRPETRVLFISGYSPDEIPELKQLRQNFPFLPKPFSGAALVKKVREALARNTSD